MVSSMSGVNLANNTTEECMKQGCVSVMLWDCVNVKGAWTVRVTEY